MWVLVPDANHIDSPIPHGAPVVLFCTLGCPQDLVWWMSFGQIPVFTSVMAHNEGLWVIAPPPQTVLLLFHGSLMALLGHSLTLTLEYFVPPVVRVCEILMAPRGYGFSPKVISPLVASTREWNQTSHELQTTCSVGKRQNHHRDYHC